MSPIMVSIICNTYNHERYIGKALESFVMQKTSFPFEILVHDDASTDRTPEIIREYEKKYPDLIKPVYQKENQYRQHIGITVKWQYPRARGKYIAFCEGDDYFLTEDKLQKQVDYMESHPACTLCIHNSDVVKENGDFLREHIISHTDAEISADQVIRGSGGFCSFNSIMIPKRLVENLPPYFEKGHYDYVLQMYAASEGETYCFAEKMSAYRVGSVGSWTQRQRQASAATQAEFCQRTIAVYELFDSETGCRFHDSVAQMEQKYALDLSLLICDTKAIRTPEMRRYLRTKEKYIQRRAFLLSCMPAVYRWIGAKRGWPIVAHSNEEKKKGLSDVI